MRVARLLERACVGYEIDCELLPVIRAKVGMDNLSLLDEADFEIIVRSDARHLRTWLSNQVKQKRSVARNGKGRASGTK
jgi:hypothetical protein